jgi:hypothetical protein
MICFANIVKHYNRKNLYSLDLWERIEKKFHNFKKHRSIKDIIATKNKYEAGKELFTSEKIKKVFNSKNELRRYIITYLINIKHPEIKEFFYWEAVNKRLSEDNWAMI